MEPLLKKAAESGLDIGRINHNQLAFAKHLFSQYASPNSEEEMEMKASPKNAELLALRYLEIVSHRDYWKSDQIIISDRFKKVETRGRPQHRLDNEIKTQANLYFAQGKSAEEVGNLLNITLFAANKLRANALKSGIVKFVVLERHGKPYVKNDGKRDLIKKTILENPDFSFNKIECATKSGPQLVKMAWLEMVKTDEIDPLLHHKFKFVGNRNFAEIEELWIKHKFHAGYAVDRIASAIKGTALKVEKTLCLQHR